MPLSLNDSTIVSREGMPFRGGLCGNVPPAAAGDRHRVSIFPVIMRASRVLVMSAIATGSGIGSAQDARTPTASVTYRIESQADGRESVARFSSQQISTLEMLNRASARYFPRLDALVVPEDWHQESLRYGPFPTRYQWAASMPRALVVHQPAQAFAAYEAGELVRWGPISSGRQAMPTPAGLFHLTWRSRGRHSTVDPDWYMPWYFNFENDRGLSFHEYALPGRPASHACIRLLERDAKWLFDWGETWTLDDRGWTVLAPGTPVLIVGCHDFSSPPPWRSSEWLSSGIALSAGPRTDRMSCESVSSN